MASDTKSLESDGAGTEPAAESGTEPAAEVGLSQRDGGPLKLQAAFGDANFSAEGDAKMVLRAFESFKAHDAAHHRQRTPAKPPIQQPADKPDEPDTDDEVRNTESLPLPAFLKQFHLKTNAETSVVMAVWASRQPNGARQFDKDSMEKLWAASGEKTPGNAGMELIRAAGKGWFVKASRGKYDLVQYGEDYVDKELSRVAAKT